MDIRIAKSADFVAAGIRAIDVLLLCNAGFLDRVRHGYYELAKNEVEKPRLDNEIFSKAHNAYANDTKKSEQPFYIRKKTSYIQKGHRTD